MDVKGLPFGMWPEGKLLDQNYLQVPHSAAVLKAMLLSSPAFPDMEVPSNKLALRIWIRCEYLISGVDHETLRLSPRASG